MNQYLRAIGFSEYQNIQQIRPILQEVAEHPDRQVTITVGSGTDLIQSNREYSSAFGLAIVGEKNTSHPGSMEIEHFFPYAVGKYLSEDDAITFEKRTDKMAFSGISERRSLGIPLIYHVQNIAECEDYRWSNKPFQMLHRCAYSALSTEGIILLPVVRNTGDLILEAKKDHHMERLIAAADRGDEDAYDQLAMEDMLQSADVARRSRSEDIYSIVESTFLPLGAQSDHYTIVGTVLEVESLNNPITKEELYYMQVYANHVALSLLINKKDLTGEPLPGRRFKGNIWLQGKIDLDV